MGTARGTRLGRDGGVRCIVVSLYIYVLLCMFLLQCFFFLSVLGVSVLVEDHFTLSFSLGGGSSDSP